MRVRVELQRVGCSRVCWDGIHIMARVLMGGRLGENLLPDGLCDIEGAKAEARRRLEAKVGGMVEVDWIDRTAEGRTD